jgi:hypothetical protein
VVETRTARERNGRRWNRGGGVRTAVGRRGPHRAPCRCRLLLLRVVGRIRVHGF